MRNIRYTPHDSAWDAILMLLNVTDLLNNNKKRRYIAGFTVEAIH
jgi:hypothetical protein